MFSQESERERVEKRWLVNEGRCYFSLRVSSFEVVQEPFFFFFFPALRFLNSRRFVDQHDREKKVRDSCVGTAAGRKVQLGIFCLERNRLEVRGEIRQRQRGERKRGGGGGREVEEDDRGAERFKAGKTLRGMGGGEKI